MGPGVMWPASICLLTQALPDSDMLPSRGRQPPSSDCKLSVGSKKNKTSISLNSYVRSLANYQTWQLQEWLSLTLLSGLCNGLMFLNIMDAVLAVKTRLYIDCFMIESQKGRIERDLYLWSSPIAHLMCKFATIFLVHPVISWTPLPPNIVHPLSESSTLRKYFLKLTQTCFLVLRAFPCSILSICFQLFHLLVDSVPS